MAANTSFCIKTALFQALVFNFLARFPLHPIQLASPALSMTSVLPDKFSCSEIILRNWSDALKTQHRWPGLAPVRGMTRYGKHQSAAAVSQTIRFKDALMMSSRRKQKKMWKRNVIYLYRRLADENTGITELGNLIHPGLLLGFSLSSGDNFLAGSVQWKEKQESGERAGSQSFLGEKNTVP